MQDFGEERLAPANGIELAYQEMGDPDGEPLLLIMGLATQMIAWSEGFCSLLVDRGFRVVRFDNRDIGLSTKVGGGPPNVIAGALGVTGASRYTLSDMAADSAGLLDRLGVDRAHVVGASMGGMIAQTLAGRHGDKTLSLTSIMSATGNRWKGQPAARVYPFLLGRPPKSVEHAQERAVKLFRVVGSPAYERDEDDLRRLVAQSYERGDGDVAGTGRQLAAIIASGDRTQALGSITAPTLVIHGTKDKMVRPSGGYATAKAITGARLELIDGMGHDLPRAFWPRIVDAIADHARSSRSAVAV
jgi:pimeloyl-ACP methyl ester carboxylesterase